ncbi:MAG TPA: DUF3108 domain-containing protein [Bryobacteraceae bacterium]|nr:DUF3108 domain-containing protein [Bryobacteraceae bacterium]HOL72062.1 DUF3108 domain-containing protein [Bryobacteraceae bacterium]HOQ44470.1 DUF3108 domain-containing protein [Bryobacteraceae bacterium]HPQ15475.1 DUF3108 domain-containing protein [Bryobacteraceae bacterium]HPU70789.1 DUF3108 domain-containing protein [Bryobacteraceae bacterium]
MRCLRLLLAAVAGLAAQPPASVPESEILFYRAEWRLIHAGNVRLTWEASDSISAPGWHTDLEIETAGLVSRLYRVNNRYNSVHNVELCVESTFLKTHEGSRRRETRVTFDGERGKASLEERDLVKNTVTTKEIEISPCEHDVIGALYHLRTLKLEPGQSAEIPISDGKKAVLAKVEAQERETIKTDLGKFQTIRYEAFLFNNVLYRRSGRLFVWLTDDDRKLPVQIRVRLPFYIGTVTLQLVKDGTGKSG